MAKSGLWRWTTTHIQKIRKAKGRNALSASGSISVTDETISQLTKIPIDNDMNNNTKLRQYLTSNYASSTLGITGRQIADASQAQLKQWVTDLGGDPVAVMGDSTPAPAPAPASTSASTEAEESYVHCRIYWEVDQHPWTWIKSAMQCRMQLLTMCRQA